MYANILRFSEILDVAFSVEVVVVSVVVVVVVVVVVIVVVNDVVVVVVGIDGFVNSENVILSVTTF